MGCNVSSAVAASIPRAKRSQAPSASSSKRPNAYGGGGEARAESPKRAHHRDDAAWSKPSPASLDASTAAEDGADTLHSWPSTAQWSPGAPDDIKDVASGPAGAEGHVPDLSAFPPLPGQLGRRTQVEEEREKEGDGGAMRPRKSNAEKVAELREKNERLQRKALQRLEDLEEELQAELMFATVSPKGARTKSVGLDEANVADDITADLEALKNEMLLVSVIDAPTLRSSAQREHLVVQKQPVYPAQKQELQLKQRPQQKELEAERPPWQHELPEVFAWDRGEKVFSPASSFGGMDATAWQTIRSGLGGERLSDEFEFNRLIHNILEVDTADSFPTTPLALTRPLSRASAIAGIDSPTSHLSASAALAAAASGRQLRQPHPQLLSQTALDSPSGLDIELKEMLSHMNIYSPMSGCSSQILMEVIDT